MDMLNMILARDSSLHCAVLQTYTANGTKPLEDENDVNVTNMGDRTLMCLIATNGPCVRMTNHNSNYKVSLDNSATKSQNWRYVGRLLDRSALDILTKST